MFRNNDFKEDLFKMRTQKILSRRQVAKQSGVHCSTIQGIENNLYSPRIDTFLKLCKWMEVSPFKYFEL